MLCCIWLKDVHEMCCLHLRRDPHTFRTVARETYLRIDAMLCIQDCVMLLDGSLNRMLEPLLASLKI